MKKVISFILSVLIISGCFNFYPTSVSATTYVMTGEELAEKATVIAKNYKTLYVMGCFGAPMTEANKKRYTQNHEYNKDATRTKMINNASSETFGFDCVNLIKGILWGWNGDKSHTYGGATYGSNGVKDVSADGMINICVDISTDFSHIEIGEAVWLTGHIGIYIGNGLAVECTPKWENGVQITACNRSISGYNTRTWTKHGKIPYVSYSGKTESDTSQNPDDYTIPTRDIVYKSSGTMTGSDVSWIQAVLYQLGYSIDVDGSFGPNTKKIVEQFQKDNGLTVDGSCGPATRSKLKELWNQKKNATYSFSYNANGGTGEVKSFTVKYNQDFAIVNNSCSKSGYHFGGWNVKRNNDNMWYIAGVGWCNEETISKNNYSKKNYSNNQVCTLDNSWTKGLKAAGSYTFYATWIKDPITMSFNANGSTGIMSTITTEFGKEYTFPKCQFKKEGYIFDGWNVYRVNDGKWISEGHGWLTESDIKNQGYSKRVYYSEDTKIFDDSWKNGCSDEYIQYIAYASWTACEHQYKLVSQTVPTCTSEGTKNYTCSQCGKTYTEKIAAKGHTEVTVIGKVATCTIAGLTDGSKCSVCGVILKAQQTIAEKGHSFSNWTTSKAATCTDTGIESRTCSICKHTENRATATNGHTAVTITGKPATCTSTGLTDGSKCSVCGVIIKVQENISMIAHNYSSEVITPTVTSQGYTLHTCSVCGNSYKDNYTDPIVENAPKIIVENQTATIGKTVEVKISIKDNPGITSMRLHLSYDTSALTLIGVTDGGILGTSNHPDNLTTYPYILSWANDTVRENYTEDGTLVTLTFAVSSDAKSGDYESNVSYDNNLDEITDVDMNTVDFNVTNGVVSISNVLIGDVNGDGKVTSKDRIILSRYLDNWEGYETLANPLAADINGDGKITSKDRIILSRYLDGWGSAYDIYFK